MTLTSQSHFEEENVQFQNGPTTSRDVDSHIAHHGFWFVSEETEQFGTPPEATTSGFLLLMGFAKW